ncbi:MAG: acetylxylan esterase [Acidobacteriia bacterium]|nr:acetylxylan esterase [Terriglobia bacterium]
MTRKTELLAALALGCLSAAAQTPQTNYDEAKVPPYTLPDPLTMRNGERVRDAKTWNTRRRPEILELYRTEVFGRSPAKAVKLASEVTSVDQQALGGKAIRKQVTVFFAGQEGPKMDILVYLPAGAKKPVPVFLGLGFAGNESVSTDPGIKLAEEWVRDRETKKMVQRRAEETNRGSSASRWPVEKVLAAGYGLATVYYGDIEPDFDGGMQYGIRPLFFKPGQTAPAPGEWAAIGAWAWGLSRAMDYLETDRDIDAKRVAVIGHSRLGKTALWAGAQDPRFSIVISNDSGEGGAAISRRIFGETVQNLNTSFPYWFCGNFKKYNGRESDLPVDSHMLLALIAPRPLYVASAQEDQWADPKGEFLGVVNASRVYELLGKKGLGTDQMPGIHQPVMRDAAYHIRAGKHDITAYDWEQYLKFAAMHWGTK